jgi:hypothetical protein
VPRVRPYRSDACRTHVAWRCAAAVKVVVRCSRPRERYNGRVREWATRVESGEAGEAMNRQGRTHAPAGYWLISLLVPVHCTVQALGLSAFPFLLLIYKSIIIFSTRVIFQVQVLDA